MPSDSTVKLPLDEEQTSYRAVMMDLEKHSWQAWKLLILPSLPWQALGIVLSYQIVLAGAAPRKQGWNGLQDQDDFALLQDLAREKLDGERKKKNGGKTVEVFIHNLSPASNSAGRANGKKTVSSSAHWPTHLI